MFDHRADVLQFGAKTQAFEIALVGLGKRARDLDQQGIAYEHYDNSFTRIDDLAAAQAFCEKFAHFEWPPLLNALAERVNPILKVIQETGFGDYYWVADQCEIATDIMFEDRASLEAILPDLFEHAILKTACQDTLRFLGRKLQARLARIHILGHGIILRARFFRSQ